ncbi:MAG: DUF2382 domain-containing protein [Candidatus Nitrosocosmicus sp.]|jgi:stress response protein YsnF
MKKEEVEVSKQPYLKEEVEIKKRRVTKTQQISEELTFEKVNTSNV